MVDLSVWAHPRSRGENSLVPINNRSSSGSSPLTRGKLDSGLKHSLFKGLIPAHAGKTYTYIDS